MHQTQLHCIEHSRTRRAHSSPAPITHDEQDALRKRAANVLAHSPACDLDLDDLVGLAVALIGDPPPLRDVGLLGAAAARPQATAFGDDAYPDLWHKAAALLHSIVENHPLVDGNKRLGRVACAEFLDLNGIDPTSASNDAVYDLVMAVATEPIEVDDLAPRLQDIAGSRPHHRTPPAPGHDPAAPIMRA